MYLYRAEMCMNLVSFMIIKRTQGLTEILPVCEIEMKLSVEGNPECGQTEDDEVPWTEGRLLVRHEGDPLGGAAVDVERLPHRKLDDSHQGVPHVVHHLTEDTTTDQERWHIKTREPIVVTCVKHHYRHPYSIKTHFSRRSSWHIIIQGGPE